MSRHVTIITTGGTIEKTYDERTGELENRQSIIGRMLRRLRLADTEICVIELMSKDSLLLTDGDRELIVESVRKASAGGGAADGKDGLAGGVIVLHGTDTLSQTGELLFEQIADPLVPIILSGAFRPFEMRLSDALQNLNESIFAAGVLGAGVYCVMHGRVLAFPGIVKDRDAGTFRMEREG